MIGMLYFLLALSQAGVSKKWGANTPRDVTAQRGLCARIPCRYRYPLHLAGEPRAGVWFNTEEVIPWAPLAFHSKDSKHALPKFRHRTRLSGDLKAGDCSLVIDDITWEDEGPYFFRVEFDNGLSHSYHPVTRLHVSDFTDKPSILPAEMVAGKPVNVSCTFNTTCDGTEPNLTWVTPADVPPSVSSTVTQWGDTRTYTSVLTLTPEVKHHGQNLTCRVTYPSVSSERTLTLTMQLDQWIPVIPLAAAAGAVFLVVSSAVICFVLRTRQRTGRQLRGALRPVSEGKSGTVPIRERLKQEQYTMYHARSRTAKERVPKDQAATTLNHQVNQHQESAIYENCQFDNSPIYANV